MAGFMITAALAMSIELLSVVKFHLAKWGRADSVHRPCGKAGEALFSGPRSQLLTTHRWKGFPELPDDGMIFPWERR
jgi:hypothetical protein